MRKKSEARRLSFVQAAGKLFIGQGFGSVTMEAIAAEAGASKVTLYSYFSGKDDLFRAFVVESGKGVIEQLDISAVDSGAEATLEQLGMAYLNLVTRPEVMSLNRLLIGEAGRYPQLSGIFYENGARQTLVLLSNTLKTLILRGELRQTDLRRAALHFKSLCDSGIVERQLWGLEPTPSLEVKQAAVSAAIEVFMAAYKS